MKKKLLLVIILLLILVLGLNANELKKKRELKLKNYYYLAKSGTRETKLNVVNNILNEYDELQYSENDDKLLEILEFLLNEGTLSINTKENKVVNDFPDVRRLCIAVLGKLGGDFARETIINVLTYDNDYTVKAECCNVIANGLLQDDKENTLLRSLINLFLSSSKAQPEYFISSYIAAIKTIGKGKSFYYSDIIRVLVDISASKVYSEKIKKEALTAIDYLGQNN